MFKNLEYISTKDMSHDQWLAERRKSIGGSDAAAILGLNEYTSAYALWAEKTGKAIPDDLTDNEAVRLGSDLESYAAERFTEATGKKVRKVNYIIKNPDLPFAHANVDRFVVGENAGLELKTTSSWEIAQQCRNGEYPPRYYTQCCHYLMVTGAEKWYLGVLCFGVGFFHFVIQRNDAEIKALAAAERAFWQNVTENTAPAIDGTEASTAALKTIYPDSDPGMSLDLSMCAAEIETWKALDQQIEELEKLKAEKENRIKDFMGPAEKGTYGNVSVTWKTSSRKTFDKKRYEAAMGQIPDAYYNTSSTRTFRVTVKGA